MEPLRALLLPDMVVGLLSILKAGAAYLPIDPQFPEGRIALMLDDAKVSLLVTQQALRDSLPLGEGDNRLH